MDRLRKWIASGKTAKSSPHPRGTARTQYHPPLPGSTLG
jgi:hypothetical protein